MNEWSKKGTHKKLCQDKYDQIKTKKTLTEEAVVRELRKEQAPVLNVDQLNAYRLWRTGTDENLKKVTVFELMTLFPAAVKEGQGYFSSDGKKLLLLHISQWIMGNPNQKQMYDYAVKVREGISSEIADSIIAVEKRLMTEIKRVENKVDTNTTEAKRIEKAIKISRFVDKEIIIYPMVEPITDWGEAVERDSAKFKAKTKEYLSKLVNVKDARRAYVVSVGTIPNKITEVSRTYKRYRVVIRTESIAFDILERAATDPEYRNKVKPGKGPGDRDVGRKRWPFNIASMKFNYSSFMGDKKYLTRIVLIEGTQEWTLKRYEWDHPDVERIREKAESGGFQDPEGFTEEKHGVILTDLGLSY